MGKYIAAHRGDLNVYDTTDNNFASPNTLRFIKRIYFENFNGSVHEKEACLHCSRQGEENLVHGRLAERTETRYMQAQSPRTVKIAEN